MLFKKFLNFLGWYWLIKLYSFQSAQSYNISYSLYCMFTTQSQVSFHHHLFPFTFLLPPSTLLSLWYPPYCCLSMSVFLIPLPFSPIFYSSWCSCKWDCFLNLYFWLFVLFTYLKIQSKVEVVWMGVINIKIIWRLIILWASLGDIGYVAVL